MTSRSIRPGVARGSVRVPGSRSITNRALVTAALAAGSSTLVGPLDADDTTAMRRCLRALGVSIDDADSTAWVVEGTGGTLLVPEATLDVGASGTTGRFITAVAALVDGPVEIDGSPRMRERPIADLVDGLRALGASVDFLADGPGPPLLVGGTRPRGRSIEMEASKSSHYVSAIMLIAPLLEDDTEIRFVGDVVVSKPYVEMTIDTMRSFGADVEWIAGPAIRIRGSTGYAATQYEIEPDLSSAVYPAAAAAVSGGRLELPGINRQSRQADLKFFDILTAMGCDVLWSDHGVEVRGPAKLSAVTCDMGDAPDASLMVAVLAAFADGTSVISNVANLRIKESDRLAALEEQLAAMGVDRSTTADSIVVHGGVARGAVIETYDDHRIAMSFAVAGLAVPGIAVQDPNCVAKTWPGFFDVLDAITVQTARVSDRMKLVVAIDGPGGSGKTTVSRRVGEDLDLPHLDTGAFYRAATLVVVEAGIDPDDTVAVIEEVGRHQYGYASSRMMVGKRDVSDGIRTDAVTRAASPVSAISEVRRLMVAQQRDWVAAHGGSAVVEGRDIGTVVFPDADLKIYLTASPEVRARRRAVEQGREDLNQVAGDLERRDKIDSSRVDSPLTAAEDAVIVDTSDLSIEEVVGSIVAEARRRADA